MFTKETGSAKMSKKYLINTECEREFTKNYDSFIYQLDEFFRSMGLLFSYFSWYILQTNKTRLINSEGKHGDVDILAGRLNWNDPKEFDAIFKARKHHPNLYQPNLTYREALEVHKLANSGGIKWPPLTDYLVGIEVKCTRSPEKGKIKSTKSSKNKIKKIREQVNDLIQMGFDKVALLDIIANSPMPSFSPENAIASSEAMYPLLQQRLPDDSPAGHWLWSIGSVEGGDETVRSGGAPEKLRMAQDNPFLKVDPRVQSQRQEMEKKLSAILSNLPSPYDYPVIFIDCIHCRKIHELEEPCEISGVSPINVK